MVTFSMSLSGETLSTVLLTLAPWPHGQYDPLETSFSNRSVHNLRVVSLAANTCSGLVLLEFGPLCVFVSFKLWRCYCLVLVKLSAIAKPVHARQIRVPSVSLAYYPAQFRL